MAAPIKPFGRDAIGNHSLDEVLAALALIIAAKPARHDDLQIREASARNAGAFRDLIEDVGGVKVERKCPAGPFCGTIKCHGAVNVLTGPGDEHASLGAREQ